jgi:hypothetical protein
MKKRFYLAAACVLLAQPALAGAREDVLAAMQRCSVTQDDRTWLECTYGAQQIMRAKLGLPPAPDYQQRLVPPASAVTARPYIASGPPPDVSTTAPRTVVASAPSPRHHGSFMQILGGTAPPVAVSALVAVQYDKQGAFIVTLENGQVWRQTDVEDGVKAHFRAGEKLTIIPGALWSYNLKTESNPHAFKVERRSS